MMQCVHCLRNVHNQATALCRQIICVGIEVEYFCDNTIYQEGVISPKIFIYFFINSDSNLTQTQTLTLKLFPNRTLTLTLTLILTPKKANEIAGMNISHFRFIFLNLTIFSEIVTIYLSLLNIGTYFSVNTMHKI